MYLLKGLSEPYGLLPAAHEHDIHSASWLEALLDPDRRRGVIDNVKHKMSYHHFDAIAFSGLSGALIAPILALELNKTLLCVRRKGEAYSATGSFDGSHSYRTVEGDRAVRRYIIIDDFTSTGTTVQHIFDSVFELNPHAQCIGVMEWMFAKTDLTPVINRQHEKWDLGYEKIREAVTLDKFVVKR